MPTMMKPKSIKYATNYVNKLYGITMWEDLHAWPGVFQAVAIPSSSNCTGSKRSKRRASGGGQGTSTCQGDHATWLVLQGIGAGKSLQVVMVGIARFMMS